MPEKGFATAEDFRRLRAEELARAIEAGEVHKVTLPSGLDAQLRHPGAAGSELFSLLNRRMWEAVEAEREKNRSLAVAEQKVDAVIAYSDFLNRQLSRVFVRPGWGVAHDEIGLGDIGQPDLKYIFRWLEARCLRMPMAALTTSLLFLEDPEALQQYAWLARESHCRPSQLLELRGAPALRFDRACAQATCSDASGENVIEW